MWWKYIDFQENIDRNVTILAHHSYIINWPACFSSSMWISFSSFSSSCFCWNRACGRKVIISFPSIPEEKLWYLILYMFHPFPHFRRKVMIYHLTCSTSFFNFSFWIHLYCSTFPSFAILLILPFSISALLPFTTTHIPSASLF